MEAMKKGVVFPIDTEKVEAKTVEAKNGELTLPGNVKVTLPSPAAGDDLRIVFSHQLHYTDENKMAVTRARYKLAMTAMAFCTLLVIAFLMTQR
jgi:hypothetical protein